MAKIKLFVMDVDGTLTDGRLYMGSDGETQKAFDIKDGAGILLLLPKMGVVPVVITARESRIVANRCRELGITELHQGVKDKLSTLCGILERYDTTLSAVAYAGDDLPDLPCMEAIKRAGGRVVCPADAILAIQALADFVSEKNAGNGAIRDCIHYLAQEQDNRLTQRIQRVVDAILAGEWSGTCIEGEPFTIQEYITRPAADCVIESHRRHIDVQYMLEGSEAFETFATHGLTGGRYDSEKDAEYWQDGFAASRQILLPGSLIVVYQGQPHRGAMLQGHAQKVRKLVCKIAL